MTKVPTITLIDGSLNVKTVVIHDRVITSRMASIALEFMKLQLPATMLADACNVEGMQKLTFEEIVARSIKLAELAYSALEEKGWIVNSPEAKELIEAEEPAGFVR